ALNTTPGGLVYRVEPDGQRIPCGQPGGEDAVPDETPSTGYETGKADEAVSLTVYRGKLYVTSHHRRGAFEYEGGQSWKFVGPNERLMSFTIYRDRLYTLVNGGPVYRYEGEGEWTYCGCPGQSTQTYGAVTYHGELYVGTWPEGEVLRYEGGETWTNLGRIGYEREVMALALYNGKVYLGTLPMANVWRMDRESFTFMGNLDNTPTVFLRRVWSMAVYQGKLFAGTLPSGHVLSLQAGRMATHDAALKSGWHHIAAVREHGKLKLFVDAQLVSTSSPFNPEDFDVSNTQPLQIGFGNSQHFSGSMSDLRIYGRALSQEEIGWVYKIVAGG
ncbi:MAG: LamG domain-containing protein, partial [Armatimonadetes bacterium]|nr:LamG domain-containing protein [Armatimonadota bacterium]